jgi:hypothetical protein
MEEVGVGIYEGVHAIQRVVSFARLIVRHSIWSYLVIHVLQLDLCSSY